MRKKSEAHENLSMVFKRDGAPPRMIVDNSKEQSPGGFKRKFRKADFVLVDSEPYLPWKVSAGECIKELKMVSSQKLISTGSPNFLWDNCI